MLCFCDNPITRVWSTSITPMPPGFGSCPETEISIWGSCGNGCQPLKLGEGPALTVEKAKQELGLQS